MGSNSKKGSDTQDIPKIDPTKLIQQAIQANRVGVNTPYGSQQYSTDANGNTVLNTSLTPEMQALLSQQMGRAGGDAAQYVLPGQNATVLNGLNTRLDQRYGLGLPPPTSGSTPGTGGGPVPVTPPTRPPTAPPVAQPPRPPVVPPSSGGGASGAGNGDPDSWLGGGACVVVDSYLPGKVRAVDAMVRDSYPCHLPVIGFHEAEVTFRGNVIERPCVKLTTDKGAVIRLSATTPFTFTDAKEDLGPDQFAYAPAMKDRRVFVLTPEGPDVHTVIEVEDIGEHPVIPLSFGGRSFAAGDTPDALIYSHNIYKSPHQQQIDWAGASVEGMGGNDMLMGSIDQSRYNSQVGGGTGYHSSGSDPYQVQGGYLGSGSYSGMGAGLAAAGAPPGTNAGDFTGGPPSAPYTSVGGMTLPGLPGMSEIPRDLGSVDISAPGTWGPSSPGFLDSKGAGLAASAINPFLGIAMKLYQKRRAKNAGPKWYP